MRLRFASRRKYGVQQVVKYGMAGYPAVRDCERRHGRHLGEPLIEETPGVDAYMRCRRCGCVYTMRRLH